MSWKDRPFSAFSPCIQELGCFARNGRWDRRVVMIVYLPYCICTVPGHRLAVVAAVYIAEIYDEICEIRLPGLGCGSVRTGFREYPAVVNPEPDLHLKLGILGTRP
jgi:hypothetical protein